MLTRRVIESDLIRGDIARLQPQPSTGSRPFSVRRDVEEFESDLVQRFAFDADQEGDRVAVLLDSDAAALDVSERAAEAVLGILHLLGPRGAPREVDHSGA